MFIEYLMKIFNAVILISMKESQILRKLFKEIIIVNYNFLIIFEYYIF